MLTPFLLRSCRIALLGPWLALAVSAAPAWACRCEEPKLRAAYEMAHAVVVARIETLAASGHDAGLTATALVSRAWVSDVPRELTIVTSTGCAYGLEQGKDYVLFLFQDKSIGGYFTRRCRGNRPLEEARSLLRWLELHGRTRSVSARAP